MKVQSVKLSKANAAVKGYSQANISNLTSVSTNTLKEQISFKGVANVALRIEGMREKPIGKKAVKKAKAAKLDSYRAIEGAKQLRGEVRKIQTQAALMHKEAVELLENGDFNKIGYIHSDGSTEWEYRDFKKDGRTFEVIDYDDEDTEIRRIIATPDKIKIFHFDTKEIKHNIYEFDDSGKLVKFGYDARESEDGDYKAKKYYEFGGEFGQLTSAAFGYKQTSSGAEKAKQIYSFDIDDTLDEYDEDYFLSSDGDVESKLNCKFEDNELVSYTTNYFDNGARNTFDEMFEFDSKTSQPKVYYNQGRFLNFSTDTIASDEMVEFEDGKYSAIYLNATKYPGSKTARRAFFYGDGYLLDGFSYYRKYGWADPEYELRI